MTAVELRRSPLCAALVAIAVTGCGADTGPAPLELDVTIAPLAGPAGPGSGEPRLSASTDGALLSWLEEVEDGVHELRFAALDGDRWGEPRVIRRSDRFFVNWADFPSISMAPDGTLWAHWLARGAAGGYDYAVRVARSEDGGATWGEAFTLHEDDSPTEHGFISTVAHGDRLGYAWLDGRRYVDGPDGEAATGEMTLRYREVGTDGRPGPEQLVDGRVCDCCQTAAALTSEGPLVVYRNRTAEEIRDIHVSRLENGSWSESRPVSDDGWHIEGCPVNGPAVVANGRAVTVAWFTAPDDTPAVKVAFSEDAGRSFGPPVVVDEGNPIGRVDVVHADDGTALVVWLEQTGEGAAEIRMRRVHPDGRVSPSRVVTSSSAARASGFPHVLARGAGSLVIAWTDTGDDPARVRTALLELDY